MKTAQRRSENPLPLAGRGRGGGARFARRPSPSKGRVTLALAIGLLVFVVAAEAQETPRHGGTLVFSVGAEPASLDGHREDSFATVHPMAPFYSLLIKVNQDKPAEYEGDLAESWTVSRDGLTYAFRLRDGVRFHDGSSLHAHPLVAPHRPSRVLGQGLEDPPQPFPEPGFARRVAGGVTRRLTGGVA